MDLFFCIIQSYSTSYHSENKLKPTSTKMKSNGPSGSLKSPVLFLCPWKQSHNLYRLNLGLHERKALPVRVQDITPMPLYLNDISLVTPHFGVQNSSTAWVVSPVQTRRLPWAQCWAWPTLSWGTLQMFLKASAQHRLHTTTSSTQSFSPRKETMADFHQIDLQTHLLMTQKLRRSLTTGWVRLNRRYAISNC